MIETMPAQGQGATRVVYLLALLLPSMTLAQAQPDSPYPDLLPSVCASSPDAETAMPVALTASSLKGKEMLVDEAERLTLPSDTKRLLIERLSNNTFSVDEAQLWAPYESFDVALRARSEEAGLLKAKFSERRLREYADSVAKLPAAQQDAIRRAALVILADTGHLPEISLADSRVRFIYREACVVDDAPGLMTTYLQGRMRELDLETGSLGPTYYLKPEKATLSDPAVAFKSDGAAAFQFRTEQIERAFAQPETRRLLKDLYDQALDIVDSPERMKEQLTGLVKLFESVYGVDPVKLVFDTGAPTTDGAAYYFGNNRSYVFHYRRFVQRLDRVVAKEQLDLDRPDDRRRARDYLFGEMVNNAAHELAHAGQQQWEEIFERTPDALPAALRGRVTDYEKNQSYKNAAWESHALIGVMGSADYDRYRHQPLEEDAWALGAYAETRAMELVAGGEERTPVEVKPGKGLLQTKLDAGARVQARLQEPATPSQASAPTAQTSISATFP
jgi:hypothetical protein